ncbi:MAG: T9SS type A sorting domain-containing protein [Prolixibacteraceae bacterium]|nr:T9SS type A sorting domain-containing protein [Prolixibacteraceae bacterium]
MKRTLQHMKSAFFIFSCILFALFAQAQTYQVEKIMQNGSPEKFINLVYLSDGFQNSQLGDFVKYAESSGKNMLNDSPFKEYKSYFNLIAIKVPSVESGSDHPRTAADCPPASEHPTLTANTFFNTTFDSFNIHRLLVANDAAAVYNVITNNFPLFDQKIILANTSFYGGSGGTNSVASLNPAINELVLHENGHAFGNLSDEYWAGENYAYENVNMTKESNPKLVRWKNWIGVDGVGVYSYGSSGAQANWYHPHQNCKMQALGNKFCPVCREALALKILQKFGSPIKSSYPLETKISMNVESLKLKLELYKPIPNTLKTTWLLNGIKFMQNKDSIFLKALQLQAGINTLTVQVLDTTSLIRDESHPKINTYSVSWSIENLTTENLPEQAMPGLRIYPSPFSNDFTIEYWLDDQEKSYEIFRSTGQLMQQGKFRNKTRIQTRHYDPGVYLVKVSINGEIGYRKIVKE